LLGLTPLECALLKTKHLEDCYARDIQSSGDNSDGGSDGRGVCHRGGKSGGAYYHGTDFRDKRRDAWKRLVLCVQAAAAAIRHTKTEIPSPPPPRKSESESDRGSCDNTNLFSIPFLQAAIEFVAWGGMDLRSDELFHLLLHTGHCDKKAVAATPIREEDKSNRLPFHYAEANGLTIGNGLLQILDAYPQALFRTELDVRILPQLIAVLGEEYGLGMIYTMMTNAPSAFVDFRRMGNRQTSILGEG